MRFYHILPLLLTLQGGVAIQFLFQSESLSCIANFTTQETRKALNQRTSLVDNVKCIPLEDVSLLPGVTVGIDYDYTKNLIYYTNYYNSADSSLSGMSFNFDLKINLPKENATEIDFESIAVDWIHNTYYAYTLERDIILSSTVLSENKSIYYVIHNEQIKQELRTDEDFIFIRDLKVDPFEGFLFFLVNTDSSDTTKILRTNLNGNGLKTILTTVYNGDGNYPFCIDVGEAKLYVSNEGKLNKYNYEGRLLETFIPPLETSQIAVLGTKLLLTTIPKDNIYELLLNISESPLKINNIYKLNTQLSIIQDQDSSMKFKLLDARVQRLKRSGKYICDRKDCPELCEVLSSGDTCLCKKDKAKARDGVMCYTCGQSNLTSLVLQPTIVGGNYSNLGDFPWHAVLYYTQSKEQFCGGTLISSRAVLTAAHCVTSRCDICLPSAVEIGDIMVSFGRTQRAWDDKEISEITRHVTQIHVHNRFVGQSNNYPHDIALILLDNKVPMSSFVMPACLDFNLNQLPPHETLVGYVPGFGYTEECGKTCSDPSERLKYKKVKTISFIDCYKISNEIQNTTFHRLTPDKFCIGNGSVSPVQQGDSGGGLTLEYRGLHYVMGVVSVKLLNWHNKRYSFGAFTNVSDHMDWLKRILPVDD